MNGRDDDNEYAPTEDEYLMSQYDDRDYFGEWLQDAGDATRCPYCGDDLIMRGDWYCETCDRPFPDLDTERELVAEVAQMRAAR